MNGFLAHNRHKVIFIYKSLSIVFLIIVLILIAIVFLREQFFDFGLFVTAFLFASIVLPIFIIAIGYLEWFFKRRVMKRAFSIPPFNELRKIGFLKSLKNQNRKWVFTEETQEGLINDFKLTCEITSVSPKIFQFIASTKTRQIGKKDFIELRRKLKEHDIFMYGGQIIKIYDLRRPNLLTIQELKTDLLNFSNILKREKFEPE